MIKSKAIVLLISLMFISAISVLILKNLKDSDEFFEVVDTNINLSQTKLSIIDTNREIIKFFKDNKDDFEQILSSIPSELPLLIKDGLLITIKLEEFNPNSYININKLDNKTNNKEFNNNIDFRYMFFEILKKNIKKYQKISNQKQIDKIVDDYIINTRDRKILNIKNKFIYHSFDTNNSKYIRCKYDLDISSLSSTVDMIFKVGTEKSEVMEFYFRNNIE